MTGSYRNFTHSRVSRLVNYSYTVNKLSSVKEAAKLNLPVRMLTTVVNERKINPASVYLVPDMQIPMEGNHQTGQEELDAQLMLLSRRRLLLPAI